MNPANLLHLFRVCSLPLVFGLVASTSAGAKESVTVTMSGPSEIEAIRYALAEAVSRINGVNAAVGGKLYPEVAQAKQGIVIEFDPDSDDPFHIRSVSDGYVRSYQVHKISAAEDGTTTVELEANVLSYDPANPRPGARPTIVVEGFRMASSALQLDRPVVGTEDLLVDLRNKLENNLVSSQKFSVLTRKNLSGLLQEQAFIEGAKVSRGEKLKLHQMLGSDYLVTGTVESIYVHTESKTVKLTGYTTHSKSAQVKLRLQLLNVASGQLIWSLPIEHSRNWTDQQLKHVPALANDGQVARMMVLEAAQELALGLVSRIFPLRVVDVDREAPGGAIFYLNAGDNLLSVGQRFELVQLGKEQRDPQTGELLGHRERLVGMVHIVRQDDKLSQAMWLDEGTVDKAWLASTDLALDRLACRPL